MSQGRVIVILAVCHEAKAGNLEFLSVGFFCLQVNLIIFEYIAFITIGIKHSQPKELENNVTYLTLSVNHRSWVRE